MWHHIMAKGIESAEVSEIFEKIAIADKTLKIYPGGYHEPHNDLDRNQVMNDVVEWLNTHLSR